MKLEMPKMLTEAGGSHQGALYNKSSSLSEKNKEKIEAAYANYFSRTHSLSALLLFILRNTFSFHFHNFTTNITDICFQRKDRTVTLNTDPISNIKDSIHLLFTAAHF